MSTLILEVNKHLLMYILFQIDFQTHVFGYPNICVWIYLIRRVWTCFLPGIKGHLLAPNDVTQLVNYLMYY